MTHLYRPAGFHYDMPFESIAAKGGKVRGYDSCLRTGYNRYPANPHGYHWAQDFDHYRAASGLWVSLKGAVINVICAGRVIECEWNNAWGWYVRIAGVDGHNQLYAHLLKRPGFRAGQSVNRHYRFGYVGQTGNATGPHLHLELQVRHGAGQPRDPRYDPAHIFNAHNFPGSMVA